MNKLRVGVILPDANAPAWVRRMLERIQDSSYAEVAALACTGAGGIEGGLAGSLYRLHFQLDKRAFRPDPDPWERKDIRNLLQNVQPLEGGINEWDTAFKASHLDVLLNLSLDHLPESLHDVPRYGVWSLRCNDWRVTVGTDFGWHELLHDEPLIHCVVEAQRAAHAQAIARSVAATDPRSFTHNQKTFLWRVAVILPRALRQLYLLGEKEFFARAERIDPAGHLPKPRAGQILALAWKQVIRKLRKRFSPRESRDRWILMAGIHSGGNAFSWNALKPIVPPRGAYWADPFIIQRESKTYLFFEEFLYKTGLGRIACVEIGNDGNISKPGIILEKPYHLSYPFVFEYGGEMYMIPETAQNRTIEIYHCARFPDQWEHHKTIMQDLRAADSTLIEHDGLWWLFVNIAGEGGSTWDELHLFYADEPLSDHWTPHPLNPIVSDVRSARPAGRIFGRDDGLVRPSQDSSIRYGYALNLNRITKLTANEYEEELMERLEPPDHGAILAVHTCNFSGDLAVLDAMLK